MPNVNLNNCRIEFHFYGDACADAFDETKIADALAEAANALGDAGDSGERADGAPASESEGESEKASPKTGVARISELVRRAAASASEKRDGV
ncbi:MAG: hypothetical protein J6K20_05645 [Thermoguttaceae bacterium]|nr:hypothetical protein [Thermoguttaceae bacterium]